MQLEVPFEIRDENSAPQGLPIKVLISGVKSVKRGVDRVSVDYLSPTPELTENQWRALRTNRVHLADFGIPLITNQPVANFDEALAAHGYVRKRAH